MKRHCFNAKAKSKQLMATHILISKNDTYPSDGTSHKNSKAFAYGKR